MEKQLPYIPENRDQIIAEQEALGFRLYEEQMHHSGWWLLFTDQPYVESKPERDPIKEIDELKARLTGIEARVVPK